MRRTPNGGTFHIEDIQDQVELALMRSGEHEVARSYVLYREKRTQERAAQKAAGVPEATLHVIEDGVKKPLDTARLAGLLADACTGLGDNVKAEPIMHTVLRDLYDGVPMAEVEKALVLAARSMIEQDPGYSFVTARLLLNSIRHEVLGEAVTQAQMGERYAEYFPQLHQEGHRRRTARREARPVRPRPPGQGARRRPRLPVRLPRPADPVRPLFPAH